MAINESVGAVFIIVVSYRVTYLIVVSKNPAEALYVSLDHLSTKFIIGLIHVKLGFVVPLLPACLPQPAKGGKIKQLPVNLRTKGGGWGGTHTPYIQPIHRHQTQNQVNKSIE